MSYLAPSPVGGAGLPPWKLLQTTEQGAMPLDPLGFGQPGTGFDANAGLFTWVVGPTPTTQVAGYRSNLCRWTEKLSSLYPGFDPEVDIVDLAVQPTIPYTPLGTERYGIAAGVLDGVASAGVSGTMFGAWALSTTDRQTGAMQANSFAPTAGAGSPSIDLWATRHSTHPVGGVNNTSFLSGSIKQNGVWTAATVQTLIPTAKIAAEWRIHVALFHQGTVGVAAGATLTARVWHRRIRTTGVRGLP